MIADLATALRAPGTWAYSTWIVFLLRYRKTALGPVWLVLGPSIFIIILGGLYGRGMGNAASEFVPHLGAGLVIWTFISGTTLAAPRCFVQGKPVMMQGLSSQMEIVLMALLTNLIVFGHQLVVIIALMVYYDIVPGLHTLLAIPALLLMLIHGFWVMFLLGTIGARYRDLGEIVETVMRIAFLATPIIWLAGESGGRGTIIGRYLLLNPFYHILEPLRGALLGTYVMPISWAISAGIAAVGMSLAAFVYGRYRHSVILWV